MLYACGAIVYFDLSRSLNVRCRPSRRRAGRGPRAATLQGMHPIILLEPLTWLRHSPTDGFRDSPDALTYQGACASVRFDKVTGRVTLNPPGADVLQLLQELQALASAQHDQEKARLLERIRQRRLARPGDCE